MPDIEHMNEDELYDEALRLQEENKPYLTKIYQRQELTPDEQKRHEEIIKTAQRILELQREHSIRARAAREQQSQGQEREPFWFRKL